MATGQGFEGDPILLALGASFASVLEMQRAYKLKPKCRRRINNKLAIFEHTLEGGVNKYCLVFSGVKDDMARTAKNVGLALSMFNTLTPSFSGSSEWLNTSIQNLQSSPEATLKLTEHEKNIELFNSEGMFFLTFSDKS